MKKFNFSYDESNDDLFVYLENSKSKGSVEFGNFVFDFNENEEIVGVQIFDASKILSKVLTKIVKLSKIQEFNAEAINFRNMNALKIQIISDSKIAEGTIIIPNIRSKSPALTY